MENKDIWIFRDHGKRNTICYTSESIRHPVKMELNMCRKIIKLYSKKGDIILDVMAGIGTTIIEGMILGRNVIGIEYEQKFVSMAMENIAKTAKSLKFMKSLGSGAIIKGDSRQLSDLLNKQVDSLIFSPLFADQLSKGTDPEKFGNKGNWKADDNYSEDPENIGNLKHGQIDSIITSPPYQDVNLDGGDKEKRLKRLIEKGHNPKDFFGGNARNASLKHYEIDSIITSPPYEEGIGHGGGKQDIVKEKNMSNAGEYSKDKNNVGNQKGKNYLTEMLIIYKECFKVLKNQGYMILVLKNFVRAGKQIRLDLDTIKLVEAAGFKYIKRHYRKIKNPSFWITNAIIKFEKKYPGKEHPYPLEEDILVFKKQ